MLAPRLLIADELSLGLAPVITQQVYETLGRVRDAGAALLIVEQHLDQALAMADEVVVLDTGETKFCGPVSELGEHASRFLGGDATAKSPSGRAPRPPVGGERRARRSEPLRAHPATGSDTLDSRE